MAEVVGEGEIVVHPNIDQNAFARGGADSAAGFQNAFQRALGNTDALRGFRQNLRVDGSGDSAGRTFGNEFNRAVDSAIPGRKVKVEADVDRNHFAEIAHGIFDDFKKAASDAGPQAGQLLGNGMSKGMQSALAGGGGGLGGPLFQGIAAAILLVGPALGAMLAGALFASLGLGAAAAAAFFAIKTDPRVKQALSELGQDFIQAIDTPGLKQALGADMLQSIGMLDNALKRLAPDIRGILQAGGSFIPIITKGLIGFLDNVLPALNKLMNSKFMADLMVVFAQGLTLIGSAIAKGFNMFLNNPSAMAGAIAGLRLLFQITAGLIIGLFAVLAFLSSVYSWELKIIDGVKHWIQEGDKAPAPFRAMRDAADAAGKAIVGIFDFLKNIFDLIKPRITKSAEAMWRALKQAFQDGMKALADLFSAFADLFTGKWGKLGHDLAKLWSDSWKTIVDLFKVSWNILMIALEALAAIFEAIWNAMAKFFESVWISLWHSIYNWAVSLWNSITSFFLGWIHNIMNWWNDSLHWIEQQWDTAWGWIKAKFAAWANDIAQFFLGWLHNIENWWNDALHWLQNLWNTIWTDVSNFFKNLFNDLQRWMTDWWNGEKNAWNDTLHWLDNMWHDVWNDTVNFFKNLFNDLSHWIDEWWNGEKVAFNTAINWIHNIWNQTWTDMEQFFKKVWDNITNDAKGGINAMIDIINKGIGFINDVLGKIGIGFRIPTIGHLADGGVVGTDGAMKPLPGFASGGQLRGPGGGRDDKIPIMASNGEFIVNAKATSEHLELLKRINGGDRFSMQRDGRYADGGDVTSAAALATIHNAQSWLWAQNGKPYVMGAAGPSAYDCSGLVGDVLKIINGQSPVGRIFDTTNEAQFFQPGWGGVNDLNVAWNPAAGGDGHTVGSIGGLNFEATPPHVLIGNVNMTPSNPFFTNKGHAVVGGGIPFTGGGAGGLNQFLALGWDWIFNHMLAPAWGQLFKLFDGKNDAIDQLGLGAMKGAENAINDKIKSEVNTIIDDFKKAASAIGGFFAHLFGGGGGNASQVTPWAMSALNILGLPGSWLGPLMTLIGRESGYNPNAQNNSDSNAARGDPSRGLMQTIGATFAQFRLPSLSANIFDPVSNIVAGLRYIQSRYGSIFNVQQAVGATPQGYDMGGYLPPGLSTVYNGTRTPEPVLTGNQWDAVMNMGGGETCVKVYIDGVEVAHRAIVEENNTAVAQAIRRGY